MKSVAKFRRFLCMDAVWVYNVETTLLQGVNLIARWLIAFVLSCVRALCACCVYAHGPRPSIYTTTFRRDINHIHNALNTTQGRGTQEKEG